MADIARRWNRIPGGSKYKYVSKMEENKPNGRIKWMCNYKVQVYHDTERAAAKAVDMAMIREGKAPVNVLKRV